MNHSTHKTRGGSFRILRSLVAFVIVARVKMAPQVLLDLLVRKAKEVQMVNLARMVSLEHLEKG